MSPRNILDKIPSVPIDENRENLILRRHRKKIEIPFTDIETVEMEIKSIPSLWIPEYYVMNVYLKNGKKYEMTIENTRIFESVYKWAREMGIANESKERERIERYRDKLMENAEKYSKRMSRASLISFFLVILGLPIFFYMWKIETSISKLIPLSLLLSFAAFIFIPQIIIIHWGSRLKNMLKTFIFRRAIFEKTFEVESGIDFNYDEYLRRKKEFFRALMMIYAFLGISLLLLSPFYYSVRFSVVMAISGVVSLIVAAFLWKS